MRIQHNIMAMGAYRNYTNNLSAMKKNLEKLSSGYKINRAGDDAAGLAISEKMRAQITGLQTAQKNAKDGISLVQTAEGALTEVHDMLNRMVTLATQSANGTYDNETDRVQLQKEMDQLRTEIDRIADSSNFNGIKLLDGSMDENSVSSTTTQINATYKDVLASNLKSALGIPDAKTIGQHTGLGPNNTMTLLETNVEGNTRPSFEVSLNNLNYAVQTAAGDLFTVTIGGQDVAVTLSGVSGQQFTGAQIAQEFIGKTVTLDSVEYMATASGDKIKFTATGVTSAPINAKYTITFEGGAGAGAITGGTAAAFTVSGVTFATAGTTTATINVELKVKVNGQELVFGFKDLTTKQAGTSTGMVNALKKLTAEYQKEDGTTETLCLAELFNVEATAAAAGLTFTARYKGDTDPDNDTVAPVDGQYTVELSGFSITGSGASTGLSNANANEVWTDANGYTPAESTKGADQYYIGVWNHDYSTAATATVNGGTVNIHTNGDGGGNDPARTFIDITKLDFKDGMKLKLGNTEYTFAVGPDSKFASAKNVVDLTKLSDADLADVSKLRLKAASALTEAAKDNDIFTVGHDGANHISLQQKIEAKDSTDMTTMEGLLSYLGLSNVEGEVTTEEITTGVDGKALTLQIGDTAEDFNQLKVSISDIHSKAIGVSEIDVSTQEGAAKAVDIIKSAINYVSDVRGTLGATQNRLDHTINNLSVMAENIQDAESTIRDTDVAEEMMAYTKNNILIQSAQAMLAQANQVPQGVLQLLQ